MSLGRRPESKSDELSNCIPKVNKIITILCLKPLKKCYIVWEHDPIFELKNTSHELKSPPVSSRGPI